MLSDIAVPTRIRQGEASTCTVTVMQRALSRLFVAEYLRLMAELTSTKGEARMAAGGMLHLPELPVEEFRRSGEITRQQRMRMLERLAAEGKLPAGEDRRTLSERVFQSALMQAAAEARRQREPGVSSFYEAQTDKTWVYRRNELSHSYKGLTTQDWRALASRLFNRVYTEQRPRWQNGYSVPLTSVAPTLVSLRGASTAHLMELVKIDMRRGEAVLSNPQGPSATSFWTVLNPGTGLVSMSLSSFEADARCVFAPGQRLRSTG